MLCRSEGVLPLLTFVQKRGNTTFYEWRTGKTPKVVERPVVEEAPADATTEDTVGWIITRNQPTSVVFRTRKKLKYIGASIHHLILLSCLKNQIDWGDFGKSSGSQETASAIKVEDDIDWGISLEPATEVKATLICIWFIHCVSHPFSTFDKQMNKCRSDSFSSVYLFLKIARNDGLKTNPTEVWNNFTQRLTAQTER